MSRGSQLGEGDCPAGAKGEVGVPQHAAIEHDDHGDTSVSDPACASWLAAGLEHRWRECSSME